MNFGGKRNVNHSFTLNNIFSKNSMRDQMKKERAGFKIWTPINENTFQIVLESIERNH